MRDEPVLSRRALLRGAGALGIAATTGALAGCDLFGGAGQAPEDQRPPAIVTLLGSTSTLADLYDAALAAVPALGPLITPIRDAHRAHAKALAQALDSPTPKPNASRPSLAPDRDRALSTLTAAEKSARDEAAAECLAAPAQFAPLLGSIAAARATHLEVLA